MQLPPLPNTQKEKKRLMQAEVNLDLFKAARKEMRLRKINIRSLMEWGLRAFLLSCNPEEAARLGIEGQ